MGMKPQPPKAVAPSRHHAIARTDFNRMIIRSHRTCREPQCALPTCYPDQVKYQAAGAAGFPSCWVDAGRGLAAKFKWIEPARSQAHPAISTKTHFHMRRSALPSADEHSLESGLVRLIARLALDQPGNSFSDGYATQRVSAPWLSCCGAARHDRANSLRTRTISIPSSDTICVSKAFSCSSALIRRRRPLSVCLLPKSYTIAPLFGE